MYGKVCVATQQILSGTAGMQPPASGGFAFEVWFSAPKSTATRANHVARVPSLAQKTEAFKERDGRDSPVRQAATAAVSPVVGAPPLVFSS